MGGWGYGWNCNRWTHKSLLEFYICENLGTWFCEDLYVRVQKISSYAVYDFFSIIQDLRQMITIIFRARNFQIQTQLLNRKRICLPCKMLIASSVALQWYSSVTQKSNSCVYFEPGSYKLHLILWSSYITTVSEDSCPSSSCHTLPVFSSLKNPSLLISCSSSDCQPDPHLTFSWIFLSSNGLFLRWGNQNSIYFSMEKFTHLCSSKKMFSVVLFILFLVICNILLPFMAINEY